MRVSVEPISALDTTVDVLVLKYAQQSLGVDKEAVRRLSSVHAPLALPGIGRHLAVRSQGVIAAPCVLFLGVPAFQWFGYPEIRDFGRRALETAAVEAPGAQTLALTIHGPGYGLDENEAFEQELAGAMEALAAGTHPKDLQAIVFSERNSGRCERLRKTLARLLPTGTVPGRRRSEPGFAALDTATPPLAAPTSPSKPRLFVAMPFADEMSDTFHYGIQGAANAAGMLAERADLTSFTGDVMEWVKQRIASATLVVADLTTANPNVYLEVGYAWGRGVPTILLVRKADELKFDVRGQRCLVYSSIKDLENKLAAELRALLPAACAAVPAAPSPAPRRG